jgi:hypothetical protein
MGEESGVGIFAGPVSKILGPFFGVLNQAFFEAKKRQYL